MSDCSLAQGTVQNPIKKILVRGRLDKPITYIYDQTAHFSGMIQGTVQYPIEEKVRGTLDTPITYT
jgi:hypothetical protein